MRGKLVVLAISIAIVVILFSAMVLHQTPLVERGGGFPLEVEDDFGRVVVVEGCPKRIVSLAPSNTEVLFALGLGERVVGVTKYCDYPPEVLRLVREGRITVVGGYADPSIERIVALKPDLVLAATTVQLKVVRLLEGKGLVVVALAPKSVEDILRDIRLVGKITCRVEEAEKLVEDMEARIKSVLEKVRHATYRPRVYYEIWHNPLMSAGPGTWIDELIRLAGGENIFSDAKVKYPEVSSEAVIRRNPEVIIVKVGYMGGVAKDEIGRRVGWSVIDAVKNDRIYEVDEDIVIRPGPRIVEGLEVLAKILHPELFRE